MMAQKRNWENRVYEDYNLPLGLTRVSSKLEDIVRCADCGIIGLFGYMYTSMAIHTRIGLGYPVCKSCHMKEERLRKKYPHD